MICLFKFCCCRGWVLCWKPSGDEILEGLAADHGAACKELMASLSHYFLASLQLAVPRAALSPAVTVTAALGQPTPALAGWSDPGGAAKPKANSRASWTFLYKTSDHIKVPGFVFSYELGVWAKLVKTFIKTQIFGVNLGLRTELTLVWSSKQLGGKSGVGPWVAGGWISPIPISASHRGWPCLGNLNHP